MTVVVKQDEEAPVPVEVLADSIRRIADGMDKILKSPLRPETLVLLVSQASGVGKPDVRRVLAAVQQLGKTYLK